MRKHHREAYGVEQVAHFLGDRSVKSRPPLVVGTGNLPNVSTGVICSQG